MDDIGWNDQGRVGLKVGRFIFDHDPPGAEYESNLASPSYVDPKTGERDSTHHNLALVDLVRRTGATQN